MSKVQGPELKVEVAAGLLFREGQLLIAQRPAQAHLGGLWEFPGGKRHAGETFQQCLARELREELGIEVEVGDVFERVTHDYPEKTVHLEFFLCRLVRGEPRALGCPAFAWVKARELDHYEFPAADARLLERLKNAPGLWSLSSPITPTGSTASARREARETAAGFEAGV